MLQQNKFCQYYRNVSGEIIRSLHKYYSETIRKIINLFAGESYLRKQSLEIKWEIICSWFIFVQYNLNENVPNDDCREYDVGKCAEVMRLDSIYAGELTKTRLKSQWTSRTTKCTHNFQLTMSSRRLFFNFPTTLNTWPARYSTLLTIPTLIWFS